MILISLFKKKILQILLFKMNKIIRKNNKIGVLWLRIFKLFNRKCLTTHSSILNRYLSASRMFLVDEYNHDLHP